MQLNIPNQIKPTSTNLSINLLQELYCQYIQNFTLTNISTEELSLKLNDKTFKTLPEIVEELLLAAGKTNNGFGKDVEAVKVWLNRIGSDEFTTEEGLKTLEKELTPLTYLVGNTLTVADLSLFASLHPQISQATHTSHLSHAAITRHFNHIQNLPSISSVLSRSKVFVPSIVEIDTENVPLIEIKADVKVPKVKKVEEGAPIAAVKPVEKVAEVVEKKEEGKKEGAAAAAGGKEGTVKKVKEKKPEQPKKVVVAPVVEAPAPWMIDMRVGTIIDVKRHPDADSLYVETIDIGEAEPRTVVSGLVNYMSIDQLQGRTLITVCNLKPANMRGVKSFAMVLCASSKDGKDNGGLEFVDPPVGSKPGDRVYFEGFETETALELMNPKKKIWEAIQPGFITLDTKEAAWVSEDKKVYKIVTAKGPCATATLVGASLS